MTPLFYFFGAFWIAFAYWSTRKIWPDEKYRDLLWAVATAYQIFWFIAFLESNFSL